MTVLEEQIEVVRPVHECFAYIADFTTTREWDSTALEAVKTTDGPLGLGTMFKVTCALPVGSIDLEYTVTEWEPDAVVGLSGTGRFFDIEDRITFTEIPGGTRIGYRAEFQFPASVAPLVERFRAGLERMGKASMAGMKLALEDSNPTPSAAKSTRFADRTVLPGVAEFSRRGYKRGRKRWLPMSAYMGDKHVLITGATAGLGKAAATDLARRGAELTLVVRNPQKGQQLLDEIRAETGNERLNLELADLSLLADVDSLVQRLLKAGRPIDVLVNNAGALFNPRSETSEGIEQSLALLLLSPYRLTLGLKPLLVAANGARVINVVSGGMYSQKLQVDLLGEEDERNYSGSVAYARAKRALMVVTEEWADAWRDENIVVNAMHPGWADTPGVEGALPEFHKLTRRILRSPEEGADTIVWLAVATEAAKATGKLFLDREPRTTHLLSRTRETTEERTRLFDFLKPYEVTVGRSKAA